MVLIFGWGQSDARDLGEVAPALCPNCHNVVGLHHVRTKKSVSLFFVPVVPYGGDEYLLCPICRHGLQLTAVQKPQVAEMTHATAALRHGVMAQDAYAQRVLAFWARMGCPTYAPGAGGAPQGAIAAPGRPGSPDSVGRSASEQLDDLAKLHADRVLTDDEYHAAVKRVLDV
jgi:hypothetical protein